MNELDKLDNELAELEAIDTEERAALRAEIVALKKDRDRLLTEMHKLVSHPLIMQEGGTSDADRACRVMNWQQREIDRLQDDLESEREARKTYSQLYADLRRCSKDKTQMTDTDTVSSRCRATGVQLCHLCEDGTCCDNYNPTVAEAFVGYRLARRGLDGWVYCGRLPVEVASAVLDALTMNEGLSADECDVLEIVPFQTTPAEVESLDVFAGW